MAFESTKTAIKQNKRIAITKVEVFKELELEYKIDKVLTSNKYSRVLSKDRKEGKIVVNGKTKYDLVVLSDAQVKSVPGEIEWTCVFDATVLGEPIVNICDCELNIELFEKPVVKLSVDVELYSEMLDIVPGVKVEHEDIILKQQETNVVSVVGSATNTFTITNEFEGSINGEIINKSAKVVNVTTTCGVDAYILEGSIEVELFINNDAGINKIKREVEFRQELPLVGLLPTHTMINKLEITTLMATVSQSEDKNIILIAIDIDDTVSAFTDINVISLSDAYSVKNIVTTSEECLDVIQKIEIEKLEKQNMFTIDFGDELVEEVLFVNDIALKNLKIDNKVNGDLAYTVVYRNQNGEINTIRKQEVFELELENPIDYEVISSTISLNSSKIKFGKEMELQFYTSIVALKKKKEYLIYLTEVGIGEEYNEEKPAMQVYMVKEGEDWFDVGKALHVSLEQLKEQCDNIEELNAGQKIVVYNKLELNV